MSKATNMQWALEDSKWVGSVYRDGKGDTDLCTIWYEEQEDGNPGWIFQTEIELPDFPDTEQEYSLFSGKVYTSDEAKAWAENTFFAGIKDQRDYYQMIMEALTPP